MVHSVLLPGADGVVDDDALAVAHGWVPLLWLTMFDRSDAHRDGNRLWLTTTTAAAADRSRRYVERLGTSFIPGFDRVGAVWLMFLDDLDHDVVTARIDVAEGDPDLRSLIDAVPLPAPHEGAFVNARRWCDLDAAIRADSPDGVVATVLCGLPHYRAVPWEVPAAPVSATGQPAPSVPSREGGLNRRWVSPPRPSNAVLGLAGDPAGELDVAVPPPSRFGVGWVLTGPVLLTLILWSMAITPPVHGHRPAFDGNLAVALVGITAVAFLVRTAWPLPALSVMSAALAVYGATGHEEELLVALLVAVATVGYRASLTATGIGAVLGAAALAATEVGGGEHPTIFGLLLVGMAVPAGVGVMVRRVRRLRHAHRLGLAGPVPTVGPGPVPTVGPGGVAAVDLTT
jgi:hypothetical protein